MIERHLRLRIILYSLRFHFFLTNLNFYTQKVDYKNRKRNSIQLVKASNLYVLKCK